MRTDPTFWVMARASGLVAYLLLVCSVLAGLVLRSRPFGKAVKPSNVTDLHRFLALLALVAVGAHGIALLNDTSIHIDVLGLLVPGRISYRSAWTGAGVAAAELMLVIYASFFVRRWIGTKTWRRLHWATYAVFASATLHGIAAGSDSGMRWASTMYVAAIGSVTFATAWRVLARTPQKRRRPIDVPGDA